MTEEQHPSTPSASMLVNLSALGGLGITVMVVAAGIGVIIPDIDNRLIGTFVLAGLAMLIGAIVAWFFVVQPHKHFDDINQPLEDEGHH